ncbi:MAG: porin [Methylotenera sp.]|nr:porin [Methylotenera sp.]
MKTTIKLAVASALVAVASSANAGIIIPAGDWTLDIGGNVNAYYTTTRTSGDDVALGGGFANLGGGNDNGESSQNNITTGLLPNFLSVSGKTRQNDLDVGFTISINPGASTRSAAAGGGANENRQAFMTIGDKSWGSIKLGKDLGIFGSDAILSDMTLLGVGSGAGFRSGTTTTLGRIGTGYLYADWKSQIAYTSPNFNGFSFTAGLTQAWDSIAITGNPASFGVAAVAGDVAGTAGKGGMPTVEAKASYEWAGDVSGKAWVGALSQKYELAANGSERGNAWELGANVNVAGFGLTGYYYDGKGVGTTGLGLGALDNLGDRRDSDGYYVQATYTIPGVGTKVGASYGRSNLDNNGATDTLVADLENDMWTVGVYHPLTKHVNLVAEYSDAQTDLGALDSKAKTFSAGAILFF